MKKIILMLLVILGMTLTNCKKTEIDPVSDPISDPDPVCNCGVIANDGITDDCYWLEIRNSCSGNKKQFCFDQDVWMNNHVGSNICVNNVGTW